MGAVGDLDGVVAELKEPFLPADTVASDVLGTGKVDTLHHVGQLCADGEFCRKKETFNCEILKEDKNKELLPLAASLTSPQHVKVSKGPICSDNFTLIEVADLTRTIY